MVTPAESWADFHLVSYKVILQEKLENFLSEKTNWNIYVYT